MNPKFFDVKKEKQDAIINAALMVFAENGYRKASTDVMVKEAGISKGLLFHYFTSKKGVYEFVYDYSIKYMLLELTQTVRKDEKDFFSIQRMIELAKTRVMKNYPYMQQFLSSAKFETHPDALGVINESAGVIDNTYTGIYKKADMSRFSGPVDLRKIIRLIGWMSDGYIKDKFREGTPDLDEMNAEFAGYLSMLRDHFYKETEKVEEIIAEEPEVERDDSVMDSMREEILNKPAEEEEVSTLSFEERLALGKKSAYGSTVDTEEETGEGSDEEDSAEEETVAEEPAAEEPAGTEEAVSEEPAAETDNETTEEAAEDTEEPDEEVSEEAEEETAEASEDKAEESQEEDEPAETEDSEAADEEAAEDEKAEDDSEEESESEASEDTSEEDSADEKAEAEEDKEEPDETAEDAYEDRHEVTISMDYFEGGYKVYDSSVGDETYAASSTVTSYIPSSDIAFYEESRLGDFTYGTDSRGGRGIPYDSSENIQIFVTDDDIEAEAPASTGSGEDDGFDITDLSEKIMSNTDRETAEAERNRELESMGPAPVLPDFSPDKVKRRNPSADDEDDENLQFYRPPKF